MAKSSIPKLSAKTSVNLKPMSKRWPVGIPSRAQSTFRRFKMTFWNCGPLSKLCPKSAQTRKTRIMSLYEGVVHSLNNPDSNPRPTPRSHRSSSQFLQSQVTGVTAVTSLSSDKIPLLHLKRKVGSTWEYSSNLTGVYLDVLHEIATSGTTFTDKNALLTVHWCRGR